jgi:hypothetical protein
VTVQSKAVLAQTEQYEDFRRATKLVARRLTVAFGAEEILRDISFYAAERISNVDSRLAKVGAEVTGAADICTGMPDFRKDFR